MYTAKAANEVATEMKNETVVEYVIRQIEEYIKEAAESGQFKIDIYGNIGKAGMYVDYGFCIAEPRYETEKQVKKIIEDAGYVVEGYFANRFPHTVIKW